MTHRAFEYGTARTRALVLIALLGGLAASTAYSDERQECRQKRSVEEVADCIERKIYDPCDDAGGVWGRTMCADAHVEVAERRITRASDAFLRYFDRWKQPTARKHFEEGMKSWRAYRDAYCNASNALAEDFKEHSEEVILAMDGSFGFCFRRLSEKHAEELELMLLSIQQ